MTEESSTASHLSAAMTTTGMPQTTGGNAVTSSSPRGVEFYFQIAVVMIGVVGTAANALILYALVASKQHKTQLLIVHQNSLDLFASFFMALSYSTRLCNIHLSGSVGYWLCMMILSDCLSWWGTVASAINLAAITVERYLKVVYPVWSQNKLHNWMIYTAIVTAWIISFISNIIVMFPTSGVIDGVCYAYRIWKNQAVRMFYFTWNFLSFYFVVLFIFVFCYWRIVLVIRRQARVMTSHAASGSNAAQNQYNQIQSNVIKTMIFVSASYAISWMPAYIHFLIVTLHKYPLGYGDIYYAFMALAYSYMCINPFIYATKLNPVRQVLVGLIPCKKTSEQAGGTALPMTLVVA